MNRPRLLPWSENGKRVYLRADGPKGIVSRLADEMEEAQLGAGREVLGAARALLSDPNASRPELRFAATRLTECLFDALQVAESRGERLADDEGEEEDR
ncbi:hypothetical protein QWJ26_09005 [Streptomyces sp. CSDS2]|uniref:hypothetical protein n=1 Tax=Streptomyces sp. CSDS2 TaxID=3055051 RepID=UPI0025B1CD02|nr:hypothetical protein [Streptomyces sp. CSDS2]MDN3259940.1 hypothetical protein [Streptomyces sp. CSDS2]